MNERERGRSLITFENERSRVAALGRQLDLLPHWTQAKALRAVVSEFEDRLALARARLESKPVITVVGPTGSGKSTLVNALVGQDDAVQVGTSRPTTRSVTVIARSAGDAGQLLDQFDHGQIDVKPFAGTRLRDALLLDTPDTNSGECELHRPLLELALRLSDVLVCVFDAANPKGRDNIQTLADWVNSFSGEYVFLVLNRCDRIKEAELTNDILPDFQRHLSQAWSRKPTAVFCVSAKSGLSNPEWPDDAKPLHDINDLDKLWEELQKLGGGAFFADHRVKQAQHLHETAVGFIRDAVAEHAADLRNITTKLKQLEQGLAADVVEAVSRRTGEDAGGFSALLCGALAQRWWGPVGLYVGLWRRLIDFWTPLSLIRNLNPFRLFTSLSRAVQAIRDPNKFEQEMVKGLGNGLSDLDCTLARIRLARQWPAIADELVASGFSDAVRDPALFMDLRPLLNLSQATWGESMNTAVQKAADRLSCPLLAWVLNLPVIIGIIDMGYILIRDFLRQAFLPGNFFLHAGTLLLLLWLLPSWLLQHLSQRALRSVPREALEHARNQLHGCLEGEPLNHAGITSEVARLLALPTNVNGR